MFKILTVAFSILVGVVSAANAQAVIFDKDGLSAAVFDNGVARLRHLDLEADDGAQVEVRSGLQSGDRLILNPPVGLTAGMKVTAPGAPSA